jgi:hypothetical protein
MSEFLIKALDNLTPMQLGENGHSEYTWSNKLNERILQLSFQLTRTNDNNKINELAEKTSNILSELKHSYETGQLNKDTFLMYMSIMYRMIAHTRDIVDGKGEYTLSYMLLNVWFKYYPELAKFIFKYFLLSSDNNEKVHPFGCWKDVKYMYKYEKEHTQFSSTLGLYGMELMNKQLKEDINKEHPSLVAKWVPREKSKFAEVFTKLATMYFSEYIESAKTSESRKKAILKAKREYRKLVSALNKKLDTVQIKQCSNAWSVIEPSKQTSITMNKQKKAFLNLTKNGKERSTLEDRRICAKKFSEYAKKASNGEVEIKGKRVGLNDFTKDALTLLSKGNISELQILNAQWKDNSKQTCTLSNMIAMVDTSGSMSGDPLYAAIALGIRVAEKSLLGQRVLTFSASPSWVKLDDCPTFVEKVNRIKQCEWGMNTNFYMALNMILDAVVSSSLKPEEVENMTLAVFSDMQIDHADRNFTSMYNLIEERYRDAGMRLWGKPFKPPHILFWNLRSTSGFPVLSSQSNVSMMSGFSPSLLNLFCEQGLEALQSCTPWSLFLKSIDDERYKFLDLYLREQL